MRQINSILQWRTLVLVNFGLTAKLPNYKTIELSNHQTKVHALSFPFVFFWCASFSIDWRDYTVKKLPAIFNGWQFFVSNYLAIYTAIAASL